MQQEQQPKPYVTKNLAPRQIKIRRGHDQYEE